MFQEKIVSRRGLPSHMNSHHGTTFIDAPRLLHEEFIQITSCFEFQNLLTHHNTCWDFNPLAAPHFGVLWEAGLKNEKTHPRHILLNKTPTFKELSALLCKIEALLDSRPIEPYTDDIDNLDSLTPGHFSIGKSLNALPQVSILDVNEHIFGNASSDICNYSGPGGVRITFNLCNTGRRSVSLERQ